MKVVNPENRSHRIAIVSRYNPTGIIKLYLYNKATKVESEIYITLLIGGGSIAYTYDILGGYLYVNFDFEFSESDKFRIKILEENKVIYRGKLIAITKETQTQNYLADNNEYYYE